MCKINRRKRVENWLENNGYMINISALEREIEVPKGAIQKSIKYGKRLNDKRIKLVYKIIERLKKS